jgi:cold shock CspA family protein
MRHGTARPGASPAPHDDQGLQASRKDTAPMTSGTITHLTNRGFGFIAPSDPGNPDVFFHGTVVEGASFDQLHEGMQVSYDQEADPRDPSRQRAVRVAATADFPR